MKRLVQICWISFLAVSASAKNVVYFSPGGNCEGQIIERIDGARKTIDAAIYSINNDKIVDALIRAKKRGVDVRVLTDRTQAAGRSSKVLFLYAQGVNIRVHSKFKIEHNKFAVYDGELASTGSFNWTNPAEQRNSENCIFFSKNEGGIKDYADRFAYLWKENTKEKSDSWFASHESDDFPNHDD